MTVPFLFLVQILNMLEPRKHISTNNNQEVRIACASNTYTCPSITHLDYYADHDERRLNKQNVTVLVVVILVFFLSALT